MTLNDPYPQFQGHYIFDAECVRNGTRYRHSFNGKLIGTYRVSPVIYSDIASVISLRIIIVYVLLSCRSRQRERLSASELSICSSVCLFVCPSVRLSVAKMQKNAIFPKTKHFRAMVSIDDLYEVVHGLFKEPNWTYKIQGGGFPRFPRATCRIAGCSYLAKSMS